jgi:class 3 adenylate cyclase
MGSDIGQDKTRTDLEPQTNSSKVFKLSEGLKGQELSSHTYYLEDASNALTIDDVVTTDQWKPIVTKTIGLGYTGAYHWFKVTIENVDEESRDAMLLIDYPLLDEIEFFTPSLQGFNKTISGDLRPFSSRVPAYRGFVFPIKIGKKSQMPLFFRIQTTSTLSFGIRIWDSSHFETFKQEDTALNSLYFGWMLSIIIYNIFISFSTRSASYFSYTIVLIVSELFVLSWTGFGKEYLWPDSPWLTQRMWPFTGCLMALSIFVFQIHLFKIKDTLPKIYNFYKVLTALLLAFATMSLFTPVTISHKLAAASGGLCAVVAYSVAVRMLLKGSREAIFFFIAWTTMMISITVAFLTTVGYMDFPFSTITYAVQSGSAAEAVLLSFALAYRLNSTSRQIHHVTNQLKKIVYPHQLGLISNGESLEMTMPTGPGEACVISFDIASSSKIQHIGTKHFFRNVFMRCNQIMSEGYDGTSLKSRGYRIKELGDGFLCSVGYPFKPIQDSIAHEALDLAHDFYAAFREEVEKLDYSRPIHCGIGIAFGSISGFYPDSGTKEYDLHGPAITLATRYESMRKQIFNNGSTASIVILQEHVYESLNSDSRSKFEVYDLEEGGTVVRDDPAAQRLYYKVMNSDASKHGADAPEVGNVRSIYTKP